MSHIVSLRGNRGASAYAAIPRTTLSAKFIPGSDAARSFLLSHVSDMLNFKNHRVLIIAPHPDDEIFGCGGMIHRVKRDGGEVYVLFMTVATTKDFSLNGESTQKERVQEVEQVAKLLKFDGYRIALPGQKYHLRLDNVPQRELIHEIERGDGISLEALRPTIVLTTSIYDYNQDHRAMAEATVTATRPTSPIYKSFQGLVLSYEFPYSPWISNGSLAIPRFFVNLSEEDLEMKIEALKLYKSQLKVENGPLSIHGVKTLAHFRGLQCGTKAAEAFFAKRMMV